MAKNPWLAHVQRWVADPVAFVVEVFGVHPDPWQAEVLRAFPNETYLAMQACKGPGKGLCKSTEIVTDKGVLRWGDLEVGSTVFAEDGSVCNVRDIHQLGVRPIYRVTFDDGSFARVTEDHLWKVQGRTERRKGLGWSVIDTREIMRRGVTIPNGRWKQKQFVIPRQGPAQFARAEQPVDPYVVGVWLGDGSRKEPTYGKPYKEVEVEINQRGYGTSRAADGIMVRLLGVSKAFQKIECFDCYSYQKFVPDNYKYASVQQRTDVLCGLMDTDGMIGKDGHMEFASTSERLANDVVWLARSLGGVALVKEAIKEGWYYGEDGRKIECRDCWRVTVVLPFNPFRIAHKAERWQDPMRSKSTERYLTRFISSIELDGEEDAMCIEVDHPSHCYLANDFIVTHNTAVLAWLCWNFLATRPHPNIGATSISGDNLRDNLFKEMAMWRGKSKLIEAQFEWNAKRIYRKGMDSTWFMSARTWPKSGDPKAQADTLAGLHQPHVMFVLDESGGIPESVMVTAEAAMSNCLEGHIVQAGNPTMTEGPLYRAAKNRKNGPDPTGNKQWYVVEITGDPDDPNRSPRMDIEWCRTQIRTWGRENPWVMVNVLGKFPPGAISSLIGEDEVREAMRRYYRDYEIGIAERVMGVDVARQGLDASVIACREGRQMHNMRRYRNLDNNQGASIANRIWTEFDADACFVDATGGFGYGWIDGLKLLGKAAIPVQFAQKKIINPERFYNKRAEIYFTLVEAIHNGLALPPEDSEGGRELLEALSKTQYFHHNDRLQLEEKDQIKDRIGFSPDEADACALTYSEPVSPKQRQRRGVVASTSAVQEYRPFAEMDRQRESGYGPGNATTNWNPFTSRR